MSNKTTTVATTSTRKVAILTKDWTYHDLQSETNTVVPAGTEYTFGEFSNTQILPNGNLRWFYWEIPKDHLRVVTEVVNVTTTTEVKRMD